MSRRMKFGLSIVGLAAFAVLVTAVPAAAQKEACVYNMPGGGYVAEMRVCLGSGSDKSCQAWTGGFPIGKTKCQALSEYTEGQELTVEMHASWGKSINCTPSFPRDTSYTGNIVFHCWGTTLSPHCRQPGTAAEGAQAETQDDPTRPD